MDDTTTEQATPTYVAPTAEKKAFLSAFAKAQGEFLDIARERTVTIKPREGPAYSFKYAELAVILKACRAALSKNGMSIRSRITPSNEPGFVWLQSILSHEEGYEDVSEMHVAVAGDLKVFGGQLTYLRRYLAAPQLGVASEDDIDENGQDAGDGIGNGAVGGGSRPKPAPPAPPRAAAPAAAPRAAAPPAAKSGEIPTAPPEGATKMVTASLAAWLRSAFESRDLAPEQIDGIYTDAGVAAGADLNLATLTLEQANKMRAALMAS